MSNLKCMVKSGFFFFWFLEMKRGIVKVPPTLFQIQTILKLNSTRDTPMVLRLNNPCMFWHLVKDVWREIWWTLKQMQQFNSGLYGVLKIKWIFYKTLLKIAWRKAVILEYWRILNGTSESSPENKWCDLPLGCGMCSIYISIHPWSIHFFTTETLKQPTISFKKITWTVGDMLQEIISFIAFLKQITALLNRIQIPTKMSVTQTKSIDWFIMVYATHSAPLHQPLYSHFMISWISSSISEPFIQGGGGRSNKRRQLQQLEATLVLKTSRTEVSVTFFIYLFF